MATTANYGWPTPDDTDFVRDGAEAIRDLGSAIDGTLVGIGQNLVHVQPAGGSFSTSTNAFVDVPDYELTITPTSDSAKILLFVNISAARLAGTATVRFRVIADEGPSPVEGTQKLWKDPQASSPERHDFGVSAVALHAPGTTDPVTYKVQVFVDSGVSAAVFRTDTSTASTITAIQVAA